MSGHTRWSLWIIRPIAVGNILYTGGHKKGPARVSITERNYDPGGVDSPSGG